MATETLSPGARQNTGTSNTLRDLIYSVFFRNVKTEQCPGFYGRTSMGQNG